MAYIRIIDYEEADKELREIYDQVTDKRGKLANVHKIHSVHPDSLLRHMDLYMTLMFGKSPLRRAQREMIGVQVSVTNKCKYCIEHHSEALLQYWKDEKKVAGFAEGYRNIGLSDEDAVICDYTEKLTSDPSDPDIDQLVQRMKDFGFSDRAIHDVAMITSYFNFVNRMVLGLGVELEEDKGKGYKY